MNDFEMINLLRYNARFPQPNSKLSLIADRLEELTSRRPPPVVGPVSHARLAEIRARAETLPSVAADAKQRYRDVFAALDHERKRADDLEKWEATAFNDSHHYDAGKQAGVADVLRILGLIIADLKPYASGVDARAHHSYHALTDARDRILGLCGPGETAPHERSLTRLRKLEQALEQIAEGNYDNAHDPRRAAMAAREALEGET